MEITWHGNTCFAVKEKAVKLIIDPDKDAGSLKGNVVLSALGEETTPVEEMEMLIDWPGEYEIKEIHIAGIPAWKSSKSKEEDTGMVSDETIIFAFDIAGVKFCHLGSLGHLLTSETVKQLGDIDVLMIDLGEGSNLELKKAMDIVEEIDPRALIPMGKGNLEKALKELGADKVEPQDSFVIKSRAELPEDKRLYAVLKSS